MYYFQIGDLQYQYLVGAYTVGIITPSRQKYIRQIDEIRIPGFSRVSNGSSDHRLMPEEVAAYVLRNKLR